MVTCQTFIDSVQPSRAYATRGWCRSLRAKIFLSYRKMQKMSDTTVYPQASLTEAYCSANSCRLDAQLLFLLLWFLGFLNLVLWWRKRWHIIELQCLSKTWMQDVTMCLNDGSGDAARYWCIAQMMSSQFSAAYVNDSSCKDHVLQFSIT